MSVAVFMFYFFTATACLTSIALLFTRNILYGALLLITTLLCLAGIYVLAFAEFVAVAQILVYAGGILVVIIFAIMLTSRLSGKPLLIAHGNVLHGLIIGGCFFIILIFLISHQFDVAAIPQMRPASIEQVGMALLTDYALPFEVAGIVLLIALIGAAVFASTTPTKQS